MRFMSCKMTAIMILMLHGMISCRPKERSKESVEQAMKTYDRLILHMDVDSIAWLYTADGEMGKVAKGRDSIRSFLESFKKFKVLSQVSKTNLISISKDTALQSGLYTQKVIVPVNDTVKVRGLFSIKWLWQDSTGWHIRRMETQPAK